MPASTNIKSKESLDECFKIDPYEWRARVIVDKNALGSNFCVYVFITPPNETGDPFIGKDILEWIPSKYFAGLVAALADFGGEAFGYTNLDVEMIEVGVSLNYKLKEFIHSLEPEDVEKHLRDHLLWKVGKLVPGIGRREGDIDLSKLPTLEVTVMRARK